MSDGKMKPNHNQKRFILIIVLIDYLAREAIQMRRYRYVLWKTLISSIHSMANEMLFFLEHDYDVSKTDIEKAKIRLRKIIGKANENLVLIPEDDEEDPDEEY